MAETTSQHHVQKQGEPKQQADAARFYGLSVNGYFHDWVHAG